MWWKLNRCLYGTRDAPKRWEAFHTLKSSGMRFNSGVASASCFYHPRIDVQCVVHGDDFTFSGTDSALDWVQKEMQKAFLCKVEGRLGPDAHYLKQARI